MSLVVRIARGECWVQGLAPPVARTEDNWDREGAFEIETGPDEHLRELHVKILGPSRVRDALVGYTAVLVSEGKSGDG